MNPKPPPSDDRDDPLGLTRALRGFSPDDGRELAVHVLALNTLRQASATQAHRVDNALTTVRETAADIEQYFGLTPAVLVWSKTEVLTELTDAIEHARRHDPDPDPDTVRGYLPVGGIAADWIDRYDKFRPLVRQSPAADVLDEDRRDRAAAEFATDQQHRSTREPVAATEADLEWIATQIGAPANRLGQRTTPPAPNEPPTEPSAGGVADLDTAETILDGSPPLPPMGPDPPPAAPGSALEPDL